MVRLCTNRAEGFSPHSSLHHNLPTSCFLDVVIEPLPTWIFLLASPLLYIALHRSNPSFSRSKTSKNASKTSGRNSRGKSRGKLAQTLSIAYYVLLVALFAMISLEIARLSIAQLGIGLLPFTYVGIVLALLNRVFWRVKVARMVNAGYWLVLALVMAIKTAVKQKEEGNPAAKVKGGGVKNAYPMSDQMLDNAVMVGVDVVLALLELSMGGLDWY